MSKSARYYQIIDNMAHVYDAPYVDKSLSVSIVPVSDLAYYRRNFALSKVWGDVAPVMQSI